MGIIKRLKEKFMTCDHVWKIDKITYTKDGLLVHKHCIKCGNTKIVHNSSRGD